MVVGRAVGDGRGTAGDDNNLGAQHRLLLNGSSGSWGWSRSRSRHLNLSIADLVHGNGKGGCGEGRASQGSNSD